MSPGSPGIPSQTWASATDPDICRQKKKQRKKERKREQTETQTEERRGSVKATVHRQ